jgi:hypothetical protein
MILELEVFTKIELEHEPGKKGTNLRETKFYLNVSKNLNASMYNGADGLPTHDGSKAITEVLTQGLIGNIHQSHDRGYIDSAVHLRSIIGKLEKGFVALANVNPGIYDHSKIEKLKSSQTEWTLPSQKVVTNNNPNVSIQENMRLHESKRRIQSEFDLITCLDFINQLPETEQTKQFLSNYID